MTYPRGGRRRDQQRRYDEQQQDDNVGDLGINTEGNLTVGLGGGLAMDAEDGSLGLDIGGFVVDFDDE